MQWCHDNMILGCRDMSVSSFFFLCMNMNVDGIGSSFSMVSLVLLVVGPLCLWYGG